MVAQDDPSLVLLLSITEIIYFCYCVHSPKSLETSSLLEHSGS